MNSYLTASALVNLGKKLSFHTKYGRQFVPFGVHLVRDFPAKLLNESEKIVPADNSDENGISCISQSFHKN